MGLLLGDVYEQQQDFIHSRKSFLPEEATLIPGKISKGEKYLGLPYLILDHPRIFQRSGVFAIRTMFLWGKFFSITLHLSGTYKEKLAENISCKYEQFFSDYFICVNEDQWQHHFESSNYIPVKRMTEQQFMMHVNEGPFLKIAKALPLQQWDNAAQLLVNDFVFLLEKMEN